MRMRPGTCRNENDQESQQKQGKASPFLGIEPRISLEDTCTSNWSSSLNYLTVDSIDIAPFFQGLYNYITNCLQILFCEKS